MKRILFLVLAILLWRPVPGQGLVPKPIPCFEPKIFTPAFDPGSNPKIDFKAYNCVDLFSTDTVNTIDKGRTDIVAGKYIHFGPGAHIGPLPDPVTPESDPHYFHAYIGENDFKVVWFEPNSTPGYVGQFEKLELGVQLPFPLDSMVYNYVHHNMTSTIEWLNPFDPLGINVEAEFSYNGDTYNQYSPVFTKKAYGFYYKEFERICCDSLPAHAYDNTWSEDSTSYPFRIRFAPTAMGQWSVKIKIETPIGDYECLPITFECTSSDNPGYVKVGANERFLQLGDQSFVPVGVNLPHPTCWDCWGSGDGSEAFQPNAMPSWGFLKYYDEMEDLRNKGGNYFRMLIAPWSTDIEFEKLNNYSDRMNRAWEVDKIIDKAKELDLRIHLNMQFHFTMENPTHYNMWFWDWMTNDLAHVDPDQEAYVGNEWYYDDPDPGYCYNTELGLSNPTDFYSNTNAISNYKKKVRYMISRWGYSTNIAIWELYSEIDNSGAVNEKEIVEDSTTWYGHNFKNINTIRPYWQDWEIPEKIGAWQDTIARYIKEDLGHTQHLISADYTYGSGVGERANNLSRDFDDPLLPGGDILLDSSYASSHIDIMAWNHYAVGTKISRFEELSNRELSQRYNNKPVIFSEIGPGPIDECDNNAEFIRTLWCSTFSGAAGPGLDYNGNSHDTRNVWQYYGVLNDFLEGNTFAFDNWEPEHDIRNDDLAEVFSLVNHTTSEEALGVIVNRTYNFFTQGYGPCRSASIDPGGTYNNYVNVSPSIFQELKLNDMASGNYTVSFYDAITGMLLDVEHPTVVPLVNKLSLNYPILCVHTCPDDNSDGQPDFFPLIAFKAVKSSSAKNIAITIADDSLNTVATPLDFSVQPNPAGNMVRVSLPAGNNYLQILNSSGQMVYGNHLTSLLVNIDLTCHQSGLYLITLQNGNSVLTKKLVIQHEN